MRLLLLTAESPRSPWTSRAARVRQRLAAPKRSALVVVSYLPAARELTAQRGSAAKMRTLGTEPTSE